MHARTTILARAGRYSPAARLSHATGSERYAVALIEDARIDVGLAGVGETAVSPGCAPAVAYDEATVGGVADDGNGVTAADGVGLERVQFALGRGGIVPGRVDVEPGQKRAVGGEPGTPVRQVLLKVEIGRDAPRSRGGEEGVLVPQVHVGRDVEGQQGFRDNPVLAQDVHRRLEGGAGALNERFRPAGERVGFLRRHPGVARRQLGTLRQPAGLDEVVTGDTVGGRPADARARRFLVADVPPAGAKVHAGRRRRARDGNGTGRYGLFETPVLLGIVRRLQIANAMCLWPRTCTPLLSHGYSPSLGEGMITGLLVRSCAENVSRASGRGR